MAVIPAALKSFTSALRRAEELEKDASNLETQVKPAIFHLVQFANLTVTLFLKYCNNKGCCIFLSTLYRNERF